MEVVKVSVPLFGVIYLNKGQNIESFEKGVSVPLFGVIYLNGWDLVLNVGLVLVSVPLFGVIYLNTTVPETPQDIPQPVSVPLFGVIYLNPAPASPCIFYVQKQDCVLK